MIQGLLPDLDEAANLIVKAYADRYEGEWLESDFEDIGAYIAYRLMGHFNPEPNYPDSDRDY